VNLYNDLTKFHNIQMNSSMKNIIIMSYLLFELQNADSSVENVIWRQNSVKFIQQMMILLIQLSWLSWQQC